MKKTFNIFFLLAAIATFMLASCKKDEQNRPTYVATNSTITLSASATAVELSKHTSSDQLIVFSWQKPNYSYNASVTYSLEFDVPTDSFKAPQSEPVGLDVYKQGYTGGDLNQIATKLKMTPDTAAIVQVRLVAKVLQNAGGSTGTATSVPDVYSDPISVRLTPYSDSIIYPAVYVAGAFQGWSDVNALPIYSFNSDNKYEGYVNITGTDLEFKFLTSHSWSDPNYGVDGTPTTNGFVTTGSISTSGGNITLPAAGYYRLKADLTAKTFEAYQTTWGVIGDATPNGWNASTPLTYDPVKNVWVIESIALTAGGAAIKFRANDAWDLSYGYDATNTKLTSDNGANIPVATAGNYKIVLDLSNSTNYNFTLTKL